MLSMTNDKGILIKNIYYMLSYAFRVLKQNNYEQVEAEEFQDVEDLFAEILIKGVSQQIKQGLYKEYCLREETMPVLKGKLNIQETIKCRMERKQQLSCQFDELTEDNIYNQILKLTMHCLIRVSMVKRDRKTMLKKLLVFFDNVTMIHPGNIQWRKIIYHRNNKNYEMLLNICYFVLQGMVQTTDKGNYKIIGFSEEHMERLFEKFILEYYKKTCPDTIKVSASQVKWNLTGENEESMIRFLPKMQTDITLEKEDKSLIIDAKYYGHIMQTQYHKESIRSAHLYQIFTYVKNKDQYNSGKVSGLLLYAKTGEDIVPDYKYEIGGNVIGAKTLDLNCQFDKIKEQLDKIREEWIQ